jgi:N-methylhydantoinase A
VRAPIQVMASHGGMIGLTAASHKPVFAVASGPAGGVTGVARLGAVTGDRDAIVFDMGGTTAKAAIVTGGLPAVTNEYEFRDGISAPSRFVKGGGYVLKVPAIDIAEVGAGGGSVAYVDAGGLLHVGPQSVGADPGPACYALGNDRPTVTDANMVLGYLNPVALAGGTLRVDPARSHESIARHVAAPLGLDVIDAAHGIRELANVNMARAIRAVTVERGRDPRDLTLVAFGGGGPVHAVAVARQLGIRRIVAPVMAGVFCSAGMLAALPTHELVRAVLKPLAGCAPREVQRIADELTQQGAVLMATEGIAAHAAAFELRADLRFVGQSSELTVPLPEGSMDARMLELMRSRFLAAYRETFGYASDEPVELVNLRLVARGTGAEQLDFGRIRMAAEAVAGTAGSRMVSFERGAPAVETPVVARGTMGPDARPGPLVVESYDTTVAVPPGTTVRADAIGNLVIEVAA